MPSDHRSNTTLSESSISSSTNSRVSSPSIAVMSSNTASSSSISLLAPSEGPFSESPPPSTDAPTSSSEPDIDEQIMEALRSKDRLYVLKLGEIMEELINENKGRAELTATTSYQRLLLYRCSTYYRLLIDVDPVTKGISALTIADSRIPSRRLADLVPLEPTTQPAFKIMQRSPHDRRVKPQSHTGSVTGEDADSSDIEPSEAGSIGGRSSATGGSNKKWMTLEEREAAYNEARSRIFMGFDEKKDKDASSSSISLASSSAGGSSLGDGEESVDSITPESDRSGSSFNKKESKKVNRSRQLRSSAQPFSSSASGSSRNSPAPSPAFSYASLYEPPSGTFEPPPGQQYSSPPTYHYPYSVPSQPNPPYVQPFPQPFPPFYYPYGQPQPPSQNPSDSPMSGEIRHHPPPPPPLPPQMMYNPYLWQGPNPPPPGPLHSAPLQSQNSVPGSSLGPHHSYPPPPLMQHPPGFGYPTPGYYTPPGDQTMAALPRSGGQLFDERSMSVPLSTMGPLNGGSQVNNHYARNGGHNGNGKSRAGPLPHPAWSYGPGVGMGGAPINIGLGFPNNNESTTGPRLSAMRRQSNTSNGSSSGAYRSSNGDDVASTASSSTSSSSRRTYTSTASSQHPLPPRPDWAVGLKPDPTLHASGHHHDSQNVSRNMSPVSPPRASNGASHSNNSSRRPGQPQPPVLLQSIDFPPLTTSMVSPEKRSPAIGGVWTNPSSRSVVMTPTFGPASTVGNALVHHPSMNSSDTNLRLTDDVAFQRPPPKATDLYNPKAGKRIQNVDNAFVQAQAQGVNDARLSEQARALSLTNGPGPGAGPPHSGLVVESSPRATSSMSS